MKLPHLLQLRIHRIDRLAFQTVLELAAGALLFLTMARWASH